MRPTRWLASLGLMCAACIGGGETTSLGRAGGLDAFTVQAEPSLEARCASPSCHGSSSRPLSLYAVHRYRRRAEDAFVDAPLDEAELAHNFLQVCAFLDGARDASESALLSKPLAREAGGSGHSRVEVFADSDDYDYRRLRSWVELAIRAEDGP